MELLLSDARGAEVRIWPILSCMQCNLYASPGTAGVSYGLCNALSGLPECIAISITVSACLGNTPPRNCPRVAHTLRSRGRKPEGPRRAPGSTSESRCGHPHFYSLLMLNLDMDREGARKGTRGPLRHRESHSGAFGRVLCGLGARWLRRCHPSARVPGLSPAPHARLRLVPSCRKAELSPSALAAWGFSFHFKYFSVVFSAQRHMERFIRVQSPVWS